MSPAFYKVIHLVSIVAVFMSFGGMIVAAMLGADRNHAFRKGLVITHGIALITLLVSGFGLMAKLQIMAFPWPGWVFVKLGAWLLLGAAIAFAKKPAAAKPLWFGLMLISAVVFYVVLYKPF